MTFKLPRLRTDMMKKSCSYKSIIRWNALENQMRSICDIDAFERSLKSAFQLHILQIRRILILVLLWLV